MTVYHRQYETTLDGESISIQVQVSVAGIAVATNSAPLTLTTLAKVDEAAAQDDAEMARIYSELASVARSLIAQREAWVAAPSALQSLAGRLRHTRYGVAMVLDYLRTPAGGWGETQQAWRQLQDEVPEAAALDAETLLHLGRMLGAQIHPSRV